MAEGVVQVVWKKKRCVDVLDMVKLCQETCRYKREMGCRVECRNVAVGEDIDDGEKEEYKCEANGGLNQVCVHMIQWLR